MSYQAEIVFIPGPSSNTAPEYLNKIRLLILKPVPSHEEGADAAAQQEKDTAPLRPGILWIHGGGYESGVAEMAYFTRALDLVKKYGAVIVAPEYRLSWVHSYPAALEDCYEALKYLKEHAKELGVRDDQIMIGGESAGGGLTAALSIYARDKGEVKVAFQMPLYPMLDDRDTPSSKDNHGKVWDTARNHAAWKRYLGPLYGTDDIPPYAVPARETNYEGLPPCYTFVGDLEPFLCETLTYVENLKKAGVDAACDVYKGHYHAFDVMEYDSPDAIRAIYEFERHYLYAVSHYFAPQEN